MKYSRIPLILLLALGMLSSSISLAVAQNQSSALERGYRTGYSDGYNSGYRDISDHADRDYQNKPEYQKADRNFNEAWGTVEDYRDGYQQGFEAGYTAGFDRRIFNSSIPSTLTRRGTVDNTPASTDNTPAAITGGAQ